MPEIQLLITEVALGVLFLGLSFIGWFFKREAQKQSEHRKGLYTRLSSLEKEMAKNCVLTQESARRLERLEDTLLR